MRKWISLFAILLSLILLGTELQARTKAPSKRVIILGVDGMDPFILQKLLDEGAMPNFKRLIEKGDFKPLQTSIPPLSPAAWASFITGMDPGGHGICDFVVRDPKTYIPADGMGESFAPERVLNIGSWVFPLSAGGVRLKRQGDAFWQILDRNNIHTTVYKMPVNFPPVESSGESLSGMGTVDIRGGQTGVFSYFTDHPPANKDDIVGFGEVFEVKVENYRVDAKLVGPTNTFRRFPKKSITGKIERDDKTGEIKYENPDSTVDFSVFLDPDEPVAKIAVQDQELILKQGEWSDWVRIDFEPVPWLVKVSTIGRFYLQEVRPDFKLYVTPLQINPEAPALPICTPSDWSNEIYKAIGYYYTQTFPQQHKAFINDILSAHEYWQNAQFVLKERQRTLDYLLDQFEEGLFFFYFSSVDINGHMLWRYIDPEHPDYRPDATLENTYGLVYSAIDDSLGRVLDKHVDENTTVIVMSDHGFSRFYYGVNINSWLVEKGYLKLKRPTQQGKYGEFELFINTDWSRTKAYASGLVGIYINQKGRERDGVVPESEYDRVLDQLEKDLYAMRDPRNGNQVVTLVSRPQRDFHGPLKGAGPDIIIGYNTGYRIAWESTLGGIPKDIFIDSNSAWSGDHQVDYRLAPGILVTNQKITKEDPSLVDLTVAVLDEFGVSKTEEMIGKDCLGPMDSAQEFSSDRVQLKKVGYLE